MKSTVIITFLRRLFHIRRTKRSFESPRYLLKWLLISRLIGIVAGIGAIAFFAAIHYATGFFLGYIVGYLPPDPAGEGKTIVMSFWSSARPWLLPVVTTLGGLVAGIIVFSLAPEAEGHGTDAAMHAFHQGKPIRARIPLSSWLLRPSLLEQAVRLDVKDQPRKSARALVPSWQHCYAWTCRIDASQ